MVTDNKVEIFFSDILSAGDFANAFEIMRHYNGPVEPDLVNFMEDSFSNIPPHDTARSAAGYRVASALFHVFTSFPDESTHKWNKVGLEIALAALAHIQPVHGLETNIQLLVDVANFYGQEDENNSVDILDRVIGYYEQASTLLTDVTDPELGILIWGNLASFNGLQFKQRMAEIDEELTSDLHYNLPLDEAFYTKSIDLDEISAALVKKRQQASVYQDESIRCYEHALTLNKGYYGRAHVLIDLAQTLIERGKSEDISRVVIAYQEVLEILDPDVDKERYAKTAKRLGTLYRKHGEGLNDKTMIAAREYLEKARELLKEGSKEELWEITHDLALIYGSLAMGDTTQNKARAIELMKEAILIGEQAGINQAKLLLSYAGLGSLYDHELDQLENAQPWYEKAYEFIEKHRWVEGFKPDSMVEEFHDVYRGLTRTHLYNNQVPKAFVTASRSRARYLTEMLAYRYTTINSSIPQDLWLRVTQARDENSMSRGEDKAARSRYIEILKEIERFSPAAARIMQFDPITATDVAEFLDPQQALLVLYPTEVDVVAFVVRPSIVESVVRVIRLSEQGFRDLYNTVVTNWVVAYEDFRWDGLPTPERLEKIQHAQAELIRELSSALDLDKLLPFLFEANHLLIVAHHPLQLVPLHALTFKDGHRLLDDYDISYLPCTAASILPSASSIDEEQSYLAISNPRPYPPWHLPYSTFETRACASFFKQPCVLEGKDATRLKILKALGERSILHFSCHGVHNFKNITGIRLLLAGRESLTINDVYYRGFDQMTTQLVVLSACESGLADALSFGDKFFNFPGLLLSAGVPSIVFSLWQIEERATALFFYIFYMKIIKEHHHPARALRLAQLWLRNATGERLADVAEEMMELVGDDNLPPGFRSWIKRQRSPERRDICLYENSYYWGAFCHIGT